jgi:hypothetical protein
MIKTKEIVGLVQEDVHRCLASTSLFRMRLAFIEFLDAAVDADAPSPDINLLGNYIL